MINSFNDLQRVKFIFSDPSIGNPLQLRIMDLFRFTKDRFSVYNDAGRTLREFCNYQKYLGRKLKRVPDHSILFTGVDICVGEYNTNCPTLGYANIGGMCDSSHSCTVNQDSGLGNRDQNYCKK